MVSAAVGVNNKVPCGIAAPQELLQNGFDMDALARFAMRADVLGYDGLWVSEEILGGATALDPIGLLAYLAGHTAQIRLGVAVLVLSRHNPILLAKSLASLDYMSQGRLDVGIGLGHTGVEHLFGYSGERRVARFNEAVAVMKALWHEESANFAGEFWSLQGQRMWPKPVQRPHPPIWYGARAPAALKRAVAQGDAFIGAGSASTAQFAAQCDLIREHLAEAGRSAARFTISKRVFLAVDRKVERAERRLRGYFGLHYGNPDLASEVSVWGDRDHCLGQLQSIVQAGATHLVLHPVYNEFEHLDLLVEEIMPHLRRA